LLEAFTASDALDSIDAIHDVDVMTYLQGDILTKPDLRRSSESPA
jgi:hypothetical protein